jgi:PAS domain-containing protein
MFKESSEWKALKEGSFSDLGRNMASEQSNACLTSSSKRAQELLLSCAARFDEDTLLLQLQEPAWLTTLQSAFQDFPLPISVCDTNRDTCPLVYVNKAFEVLVGRPSRKLLGKRLNVLNGPETELMLLDRVLEAQQCNLPCKVAITHYAANGSERFLDLLALRPSGGYSFAVHCPANRRTLADDLKVSTNPATRIADTLLDGLSFPPCVAADGGRCTDAAGLRSTCPAGAEGTGRSVVGAQRQQPARHESALAFIAYRKCVLWWPLCAHVTSRTSVAAGAVVKIFAL